MLHNLIAIEGYEALLYFFLPIAGVTLWYYLLRGATKSSETVKNQEIMIHLMTQLYKKQGATQEEVKELEEYILNK